MSEDSSPCVLLVDEDETLLRALQRVLRPQQRTVLAAADADAARACLRQNEIGVIVCEPRDLRLSEFLIETRERYPGIVRVILTGYPNLSSVIRAVNLTNPFKLLSKPWQDEELCATVQLACEQYARAQALERQLGEYRNIRASAERSHAFHALGALLHAIHPDINRQELAGLPVGALLVQDQTVVLVNPAAQGLLATLGLEVPAPGSAQAGLPAGLTALLDAPRRARLCHQRFGAAKLAYFVMELNAGTLLCFALTPRFGHNEAQG